AFLADHVSQRVNRYRSASHAAIACFVRNSWTLTSVVAVMDHPRQSRCTLATNRQSTHGNVPYAVRTFGLSLCSPSGVRLRSTIVLHVLLASILACFSAPLAAQDTKSPKDRTETIRRMLTELNKNGEFTGSVLVAQAGT